MTQTYEESKITLREKQVLRNLASQIAAVASLDTHDEKIHLWKKLNGLEPVRPMVWINPYQIPWNEIRIENDLECSSPFSRNMELGFRKILYQWNHFPADMVVDPFIVCPLQITVGDIGINEQSSKIYHDGEASIASHCYQRLINDEKDIEKLHAPEIIHDKEATETLYAALSDLFDGILPVARKGQPGFWFAPWDMLTTWYGAQEILMDMAFRPDFLKAAMEKLTTVYLEMLETYKSLNLLELNNGNYNFGNGTGGPGYTDELPARDFSGTVRTCDLWGSAAAQIFSEVSPEMHLELALNYEIRWLNNFGLNYYGCCEPLHNKVEILKNIPNLRKISMSPWTRLDVGADNIQDKYVFSYKPNPAVFAEDQWDPNEVKDKMRRDLEILRSRGCIVEIILKDVSTIRNDPARLADWARIVCDLAKDYEGHLK